MTATGTEGGAPCLRCGGIHGTDQDCRERSRVGEVADKYRIVRLIGQGGMGTVYEAQHTVVGRRFAVKFLHADLARQDDLLARFRREAQAAGQLENENIAQVIDFGHAHDGVPFIVMEFLIGEDLAGFLAREGQLPLARAAGLIIQACRGLDAAHAAGIVHRDLKPENLFLSKRGDGSDLLKILDFGIAKLTGGAGGPGGSVTRTGSTMGTPYYMPPEQARGEKDLDHRADVYAMGVILFETLTGQKPHPGDSYNAILYHILTQPPTDLAALRPGLPAEVSALVRRALSSQARDRPESAMALARGLAPFAGRQITPLTSQFELRAVSNPIRSSAAGTPGSNATTPSTPVEADVLAAIPPATPDALSDTSPEAALARGGARRRRTLTLAAAGLAAVVAAVVLSFRTPPPSSRNEGASPDVAPATAPRAAPARPAPADVPLPAGAGGTPDPQPAQAADAAQELSDRPSRPGRGRPRGQSKDASVAAHAPGKTGRRAAEAVSDQPFGETPPPSGARRRPVFERDNPYQ